jgi:UMF1 family MFS transporter
MSTPAPAAPAHSSTAAWVIYDLANTIFALGVVGLYLPDWITTRGLPDSALSAVTATAGAAVAVGGPWVGARSDHRGRRLPGLRSTTLVAIAATASLASLPAIATFVALFVALVAVNIGSVLYDALLPDVSTPATRGWVSGLGVGVGYFGSFIGLGIGVVTLDVLDLGHAATFQALAAGFLLFSLPAFLWIDEPPRPPRAGSPPSLAGVVGDLIRSWQRAGEYPGLVRFLVGRFLYTDAINTLIGGFLAIYALEELGLDRAGSRNLLGLAIAAAVLGGLAGGRAVQRLGPRRTLRAVLVLWMIALASGILAALVDRTGLIGITGALGGIALGGTWAADLVVMTRIAPPRHLGEFYGLYATVGRFATILGPLVWALVVDVLGWGRTAAMGALLGFVAAGWRVLRGIDDRPREWPPDDT